MATEGLKIQKKQPTPFQLFSIFLGPVTSHPPPVTCHSNVPPESRSAKVDRHTLLRDEDFPINIKCLLHDDFLVEFFAGLAITPIQTSCRNHCATQPKTNESLHHSCGRLRDILLKSLQTRYPLFPITF
jgi:hypothetical protein